MSIVKACTIIDDTNLIMKQIKKTNRFNKIDFLAKTEEKTSLSLKTIKNVDIRSPMHETIIPATS